MIEDSVEGKIQKFLRSKRCFTCPILHVTMRKDECLARQKRKPEKRATRRGTILLYNNPEDHFCRPLEGRRISQCTHGAELKRVMNKEKKR